MDTIFDKLKQYLENNSQSQVKNDWNLTKDYDNVNSPSAVAFIDKTKVPIDVGELHKKTKYSCKINFENPNFGSDFLFK